MNDCTDPGTKIHKNSAELGNSFRYSEAMKEQEVLWQTINTHTTNIKACMNETSPLSDSPPVRSVPNLKTNNPN